MHLYSVCIEHSGNEMDGEQRIHKNALTQTASRTKNVLIIRICHNFIQRLRGICWNQRHLSARDLDQPSEIHRLMHVVASTRSANNHPGMHGAKLNKQNTHLTICILDDFLQTGGAHLLVRM
jgi:hypothetical protein